MIRVFLCDDALHRLGSLYASYTFFVLITIESRAWIYRCYNAFRPSGCLSCCPFQGGGSVVVVVSLLNIIPIAWV